jgi:hypothetical protein
LGDIKHVKDFDQRNMKGLKLENLGVGGRVILKQSFRKSGKKAWNTFI